MSQPGAVNHSQDFFLSLAKEGHRAWNSWRTSNPSVKVTFEGVDFSRPTNSVDFSGFDFGDDARFCRCHFSDGPHPMGDFDVGMAKFTGARFGENATFFRATFGNRANLSGMTVGSNADLRATFGDRANLAGSIFGDKANFSGAKFTGSARLAGISFADEANLSDVSFSEEADLTGSLFGNLANFSRTRFRGSALFEGATFGSQVYFTEARFYVGAYFSVAIFARHAIFTRAQVRRNLDCAGAVFGDNLVLSDITVSGDLDLRSYQPQRWTEVRQDILHRLGRDVDRQATATWSTQRRHEFLQPDRASMEIGGGSDSLLGIDLDGARIEGTADFTGRNVLKHCKLTRSQFCQPPIFEDCTGIHHLDFYNAQIGSRGLISPFNFVQLIGRGAYPDTPRFPRFRGLLIRLTYFLVPRRVQELVIPLPGWTTNGNTSLRLRRMRKIAEETKNHDLERDLYIEERKAERGIQLAQHLTTLWRHLRRKRFASSGVFGLISYILSGPLYFALMFVQDSVRVLAHLAWIIIMLLYSGLSNYGRSWLRPLVALLVSVVAFQAIYLMVLSPSFNETGSLIEHGRLAIRRALSVHHESAFDNAVRLFSAAHAAPVLGAFVLDKDVQTILLCHGEALGSRATAQTALPRCPPTPLPSFGFQMAVLGQSTFSAVCLFLMAVALRNYFRLR